MEPLEFEPLEFEEEVEDDEVEGVLPVLVVLPKRLVAAVNAEDAFDVEPPADELVELDGLDVEDEAEDEAEAVVPEPEPEPDPGSRPRSPRLPLKLGVTSDA